MHIQNFHLRREDSAILVIDLQDKLLTAIHDEETIRRNTSVLLEAAKTYGLSAFYSEQYPKGLGATNALILDQLQKLDAFGIEKTAYSALSPEMGDALKKSGRGQIVVAGAETHVCVFQTVRALLQAGYSVYVPVDAVSSRTEQNRTIGLDLMEKMGAMLTSTETVLFDLIGDAGDVHFKSLQALIK